jgi:hypothetical protein
VDYNRPVSAGTEDEMWKLLKRLVVLAALVGAGMLLWEQRAKLAPLANNNLRIQGTWYQVEMDRKGVDPYEFTERIIILNGVEWGSYELRRNTELEVMVDNVLSDYRLDFPDEDTMVWWGEVDGEEVAVMRWQQ